MVWIRPFAIPGKDSLHRMGYEDFVLRVKFIPPPPHRMRIKIPVDSVQPNISPPVHQRPLTYTFKTKVSLHGGFE
jgi:hypothetical protein